jgi:hypothetical protein
LAADGFIVSDRPKRSQEYGVLPPRDDDSAD